MHQLTVPLNIPADDYLRLYQGVAKDVRARSLEGKVVKFPAQILRPFVTHQGVCGTFAILFDDDNKFCGINKIDLI